MDTPRRRVARIAAVAMIAAVALAGCSSGASDEKSTSAAPAGGENRAAAPQDAAGMAEPGAPKAPAADLAVDQRAIVYTGSITVRVKDVNQAAAQATGFATGAGGFVGGDKRSSASGAADATLELRVPSAKFFGVVDQLAGLGAEEQRGINTEDVTEQTLDLDARITTQQARVDSGRRLLAQAKGLSDLVMLENELAKREADLASLTAKKRHLADLTALSTITVVLLDPAAAVAKSDDSPTGFLGGLKNGWKALLASLAVLLTVIGALLPWLIAIGLPVWGVLWLVRRLRPRRPTTPLSAGPALPPYPPRGPLPHPNPSPHATQPAPAPPTTTPPPAQ
jgi:hypothetical protein